MNVYYDTENLDLELKGSKTLLEACLKNKVPISHSCEGMASCGTCRILVLEGVDSLPLRNELENDMAEDRTFAIHERLACQMDLATLKSSLKFKLPED